MAKKAPRPATTSTRRSKGVRRPVRTPAPKCINFPIDKLPPEIVHMICVYLKPADLVSLRLVSRLAAPIGLQYLVPEAHLVLAKESFEQLKALAEHPIASKYVTSLFFEADKLDVLDRKLWEEKVVGPEYLAQIEEVRRLSPSCHHATERSIRTFKREFNKFCSSPHHHYTEEQMEKAFKKYTKIIHFQHDSEQRAIQEKGVAEAMKHFPNLKEFKMTTHLYSQDSTSRLKKALEPAYYTAYGTHIGQQGDRCQPIGLPQMRSLLLGAYSAGLKVESLQCDLVSWRILMENDENFARMKDSMSNVKNLRLEFATGGTNYDPEFAAVEVEECYSIVQGGRLRHFVAAAPHLEHLQIGFQSNDPEWPAYLEDIVGEHHWPSLKTVSFKMIGATENDLVSFCTRHAGTLTSLHLTTMGLEEGDWFSAFSRMRKVLMLDTMEVNGCLEGGPEELDFEMDSEGYYPALKEGIEAYFLGPLSSDERSLDEFLDFYMANTDDTLSELWSELDTDSNWW